MKERDRPILVPVDFSEHSVAALCWAAEAARRLDLPLVVLHVVHDPASAPGYYGQAKDTGETRLTMEAAAKGAFADFMQQVREEHPEVGEVKRLTTSLVVGLPATRILEVAEREGASQIVMGSQGRTGLAHLLLGSKAEQVVRLAPVPVTIVKAQPPAWRRG